MEAPQKLKCSITPPFRYVEMLQSQCIEEINVILYLLGYSKSKILSLNEWIKNVYQMYAVQWKPSTRKHPAIWDNSKDSALK